MGKDVGRHVRAEDSFPEVLLPVEIELTWQDVSYGVRLSSLSIRVPGNGNVLPDVVIKVDWWHILAVILNCKWCYDVWYLQPHFWVSDFLAELWPWQLRSTPFCPWTCRKRDEEFNIGDGMEAGWSPCGQPADSFPFPPKACVWSLGPVLKTVYAYH